MTHNLALCLFGDVQSSFKTIRETKQIHQNYLEKNNVKGIYKPTQALSLGEGAVQVRFMSGLRTMVCDTLDKSDDKLTFLAYVCSRDWQTITERNDVGIYAFVERKSC